MSSFANQTPNAFTEKSESCDYGMKPLGDRFEGGHSATPSGMRLGWSVVEERGNLKPGGVVEERHVRDILAAALSRWEAITVPQLILRFSAVAPCLAIPSHADRWCSRHSLADAAGHISQRWCRA